MRRIYEIDENQTLVIQGGDVWTAKVVGSVVAVCEHGLEHTFDID